MCFNKHHYSTWFTLRFFLGSICICTNGPHHQTLTCSEQVILHINITPFLLSAVCAARFTETSARYQTGHGQGPVLCTWCRIATTILKCVVLKSRVHGVKLNKTWCSCTIQVVIYPLSAATITCMNGPGVKYFFGFDAETDFPCKTVRQTFRNCLYGPEKVQFPTGAWSSK